MAAPYKELKIRRKQLFILCKYWPNDQRKTSDQTVQFVRYQANLRPPFGSPLRHL